MVPVWNQMRALGEGQRELPHLGVEDRRQVGLGLDDELEGPALVARLRPPATRHPLAHRSSRATLTRRTGNTLWSRRTGRSWFSLSLLALWSLVAPGPAGPSGPGGPTIERPAGPCGPLRPIGPGAPVAPIGPRGTGNGRTGWSLGPLVAPLTGRTGRSSVRPCGPENPLAPGRTDLALDTPRSRGGRSRRTPSPVRPQARSRLSVPQDPRGPGGPWVPAGPTFSAAAVGCHSPSRFTKYWSPVDMTTPIAPTGASSSLRSVCSSTAK